jgi:transmembrane sensor
LEHKYNHFKCNDFILDDDFRAWLNGDAPEKDHLWRSWLLSNPAAEIEVEKARNIFQAFHVRESKPDAADIEGQWKRLNLAIAKPHREQSRIRRIWPIISILAAASVILVFFFAGSYLYPPAVKSVTVSSVNEEVGNGQQRTIKLPDGTQVKLNSGSVLTYPKIFSDTLREVTLSGEAFFEVVKNPAAPFIIHTGEVITRVLGTSFNISAYPETDQVQVAVVEGRVNVKTNLSSPNAENSVCIVKDEMATFQKVQGELTVSAYDEKEQIGWKDGILYFEKSDFSTAVKKLERWYGVDIQIKNKHKLDDPSWRFSGKFQNKSLDYILNTMSYPNRFSFSIHYDKVNLE